MQLKRRRRAAAAGQSSKARCLQKRVRGGEHCQVRCGHLVQMAGGGGSYRACARGRLEREGGGS